MEQKESYTLSELYDNLEITLTELGRQSNISEVTIARIRDGKPTRRNTANRLLRVLSNLYNRPLSLNNVTGINLQNKKTDDTTEEGEDAA